MPGDANSRFKASLTRAARYGSRVLPAEDEELDLTRREALKLRRAGTKMPRFGQKQRGVRKNRLTTSRLTKGR